MGEVNSPERIPFQLTETDVQNLAGGDEKFQPHNWEDLKRIIAENNLSVLKRKPSDLRRYIAWTNQTKATFPSVTDFVCSQRLYWQPLSVSSPESGPLFKCKSSVPLSDPDDYKILLNDWPYGLTMDVTHIVVWSKVRLPDLKPDGRLTAGSIVSVSAFVEKTFTERLAAYGDIHARESVLWFRNWTGLQSVRGLEHVHVLVRNAPKALLVEWIESKEAGP